MAGGRREETNVQDGLLALANITILRLTIRCEREKHVASLDVLSGLRSGRWLDGAGTIDRGGSCRWR